MLLLNKNSIWPDLYFTRILIAKISKKKMIKVKIFSIFLLKLVHLLQKI
jgi:hypothetical protein